MPSANAAASGSAISSHAGRASAGSKRIACATPATLPLPFIRSASAAVTHSSILLCEISIRYSARSAAACPVAAMAGSRRKRPAACERPRKRESATGKNRHTSAETSAAALPVHTESTKSAPTDA